MAICELSDLEESQCACRLHIKSEVEVEPLALGMFNSLARRPFPAGYRSKCPECTEAIHVGELLLKNYLGYVHEECAG